MTTRITLQEYGGPRLVDLDADQTRLFMRELARIKKGFPAERGYPYRIAPECTVTIRKAGKETKYLLYERSVLLQMTTKKKWQFYFGLLLHEWLFR